MTVYEVEHNGTRITVEAVNGIDAVLVAAEEMNNYDGIFHVYNCMGDMYLGSLTWEDAFNA